MPITAKSLIDKASVQLLDTSNKRWTRAELLGWLNDGQRYITVVKPASCSVTDSMALVAGARQSIPVWGYQLLDVMRNLGTDGATPGASIRIISREVLEGYDMNWSASTPSTVVQNYTYNPQEQMVFYVYPPSTGTNYVEITYSVLPEDITSETANIGLTDAFGTILLDYILFRAQSKDGEQSIGAEHAKLYFESFSSALEAMYSGHLQNNPNVDLGAGFSSNRGPA